ncbi:MAG TPA: hypothetical protein VJX68_08560 [Candidatus Binatus sp.]|nr:hypothetical protein [Candidatus Binatus sp.]HKN13234.1 hypothetical protein [Candidatus Binatus sp.]
MPHGFLRMDVLSGCKQELDKNFDFLGRTIWRSRQNPESRANSALQ